MLNKEICQECINKRIYTSEFKYLYSNGGWSISSLAGRWSKDDEKNWKKGYVICDLFKIHQIVQPLLLRCKYYLEQMLVSDES